MGLRLSMTKVAVCTGLVFLAFSSVPALADGTHTLGSPVGLTTELGTGIVVAGTGLLTQPATIDIDIPIDASVMQVLLYWEGFTSSLVPGDDTVTINGTSVTGTLIGGPANFFAAAFSSTFRADITEHGFVVSGPNTLTLSDLVFDEGCNGASLLVIIDDGGGDAHIDIRDGDDSAFYLFSPPLDTTVPQVFDFAAADEDRVADLALFAGSVGEGRPNIIEVTVNGTVTEYVNVFYDSDGGEWDTAMIQVIIPAGTTQLTVQALSKSDGSGRLPASIVWVTAALSLPEFEPPSDNLCDGGKPSVLTMRYTGDDCSATSHSQDPDMVSCSGDPMDEEMVRILATNKGKLNAKKFKVWHDGPVALGETFDIDSANAGASRLGGNTYIYVFDMSGNLLQRVVFHTSCSQPLNIGDQYGSLALEAMIIEVRERGKK